MRVGDGHGVAIAGDARHLDGDLVLVAVALALLYAGYLPLTLAAIRALGTKPLIRVRSQTVRLLLALPGVGAFLIYYFGGPSDQPELRGALGFVAVAIYGIGALLVLAGLLTYYFWPREPVATAPAGLSAACRAGMDGRGRWMDNVFIERLWRSLKYEEVYLKAYETVAEAIRGIGDYFDLYNEERPHQALARLTPNEVYAGGFPLPEAA